MPKFTICHASLFTKTLFSMLLLGVASTSVLSLPYLDVSDEKATDFRMSLATFFSSAFWAVDGRASELVIGCNSGTSK
eukprot:Skav203475  [mRNA]  locus=scaffold921:148435:148668:- [translate_table: standard]